VTCERPELNICATETRFCSLFGRPFLQLSDLTRSLQFHDRIIVSWSISYETNWAFSFFHDQDSIDSNARCIGLSFHSFKFLRHPSRASFIVKIYNFV
jgi:hypothetical protein